MLYVCLQGWIEVHDSRNLIDVTYRQDIPQRIWRPVVFVSINHRDRTWNWQQKSSHPMRLTWLFPIYWRSRHRICFVRVDQVYKPWHKRCSLPPYGPYLATSNISPNNSQHETQRSMLQKWTFLLSRRANMSNWWSSPHDDVIKWMKRRARWRQKGSEPMEHCVACNPKRSSRPRKNQKRTVWAVKRKSDR